MAEMIERKLLIRVDGGRDIGLGHLSRTFALAKFLKSIFKITFVCRYLPRAWESEIKAENFALYRIESESDWIKTNIKPDMIVVLDGYHFDIELQKLIRSICLLVVIDDIHDRSLSADLIINPSPNAPKISYLAEGNKNLALGLKYLILNPIFLNEAKQIYDKRNSNVCFICMGGSDSQNYTEKVVAFAIDKSFAENYNVVIGPAYKFEKNLYELYGDSNVVKIVKAPSQSEILQIMQSSDKAICASGSMAFEYSCTGGELGLIKIADNQKNNFDFFLKNNMAFDFFGNWDYNPEVLIKNQKNIITGESPAHLLKIFLKLSENEL